MTVDAIIFDLDGTIIDTESPDFVAWQEVYQAHGLALSADLWERRIGSVDPTAFDPLIHLEATAGIRLGQAGMQAQFRRYLDLCAQQQPLPGVVDYLEQASARGIKLAVASNSDRGWVEHWLKHLNLRRYFRCVVTRDDIVAPKPAPDIYLKAAACVGVGVDRCVAIEDSAVGMTAALAAGIRTIAVPNRLTATHSRPAGVALTLRSLADLPFDVLVQRL